MNRLISFLTILALLSSSGSALAVEKQPTEVPCPTVTLQLSPCLDYIKRRQTRHHRLVVQVLRKLVASYSP